MPEWRNTRSSPGGESRVYRHSCYSFVGDGLFIGRVRCWKRLGVHGLVDTSKLPLVVTQILLHGYFRRFAHVEILLVRLFAPTSLQSSKIMPWSVHSPNFSR
ncbi:hypothetical protein AVEN_182742-1 [Araneus ventricosus]|uniref:Uncharacterized protein n=1 Tax=Araneus ventricosus TaxID=182803 RepID=A0A4Y2N401_ARAVE|nr:hypothetical protein AVEN_182742-1 [Araneus ventricosus]